MSDLERRRLRRLALHDGLERRPAVGRAHLPAAGRARRIRARSAAASAPAPMRRRWASPMSIAFDMGGTTAKCALVENGRFSVELALLRRRLRARASRSSRRCIDIVEVGSGGGSIAWLDAQNRLHVGPQSAGSTPGPACYGHGGTEPTVTDANLVLGRLNPEHFLGGEMKLDVERRARGDRERIAAAARLCRRRRPHPRWRTASSRIATVIMAGAIKQISVEHGLDPREFVLFCLWRRRPAACLRAGARAVDPDGRHSARARQFLGRRHAARRRAARSVARPSPACSTTATDRRDRASRSRAMEREARDALARDFGAGEVVLRALRRDALSRPAPQHQGADPGLDDAARDPRRRSTATTSAATATPMRAPPPNSRRCISPLSRGCGGPRSRAPAARRSRQRGAARTRPVYFGEAGGMRRRAQSTIARARAGLRGRRAGDDRGIRLDHAGLAGRPVRDRRRSAKSASIAAHAAGDSHDARSIAGMQQRDAVDPITLEVIRHGLVSITNQIDANIKRTAFSPTSTSTRTSRSASSAPTGS